MAFPGTHSSQIYFMHLSMWYTKFPPRPPRPRCPLFVPPAGGQRVMVHCPHDARPGQKIRFQLPIQLSEAQLQTYSIHYSGKVCWERVFSERAVCCTGEAKQQIGGCLRLEYPLLLRTLCRLFPSVSKRRVQYKHTRFFHTKK